MSYVGPPFEFDLFVSYARAEKVTREPLLLKWSHHVADTISDCLKHSFDPGQPKDARMRVFLDRDGIESGDRITDEIRAAVDGSAFLLVILSKAYIASRWCADELKHHFDKVEREGREERHCSIILAQPVLENAWPSRLQGRRGETFCDPDPGGFAYGFLGNFKDPRLIEAILQMAKELSGRIVELRKKLEAQRLYDEPAAQSPPEMPVIYLDGQYQDLQSWQNVSQTLVGRAIVQPPSLPNVQDDASSANQREKKLDNLKECDGLALLRTNGGAEHDRDLMRLYQDRRRLYQKHRKNIPWAVVDEVGDEWPTAKSYRAPQVMTSDPAWPDRLLETLFKR